MESINERLYALYAEKWGAIGEALQESVDDDPVTPTNPLLLYVDNEEAWQRADLRVMVFGQETNDWENEYHPDKTIERLCGVYDRFFNKGECWSYGGHFWNGLSRLKKTLDEKLPSRQVQYLWNNIIKVGKAYESGRPPECIYGQERLHFGVIPEEVNILRPNVLLFFTGPNYDDAIRNSFGEVGYAPVPPFDARQLARLSVPAAPTADFAFRTYHPGYLFRDNIDRYLDAIAQEIKG
jgi:hypothetical protein